MNLGLAKPIYLMLDRVRAAGSPSPSTPLAIPPCDEAVLIVCCRPVSGDDFTFGAQLRTGGMEDVDAVGDAYAYSAGAPVARIQIPADKLGTHVDLAWELGADCVADVSAVLLLSSKYATGTGAAVTGADDLADAPTSDDAGGGPDLNAFETESLLGGPLLIGALASPGEASAEYDVLAAPLSDVLVTLDLKQLNVANSAAIALRVDTSPLGDAGEEEDWVPVATFTQGNVDLGQNGHREFNAVVAQADAERYWRYHLIAEPGEDPISYLYSVMLNFISGD